MATGNYAGLNGSAYWLQRTQEMQDEVYKDVKKTEKLIAKHYLQSLDDIKASLSLFYTKYADENAITYSEAMKQMNSYDISTYGSRMQSLKQRAMATNNPFVIAEMEKLFQVGKIARLNALMAEIDAQLILLGHAQQIEIEEILEDVYENTFYKTAFAAQTFTGVGATVVALNPTAVKEAVTFPWHDGSMFSDRIWNDRNKLVNEMRQTITQGVIQGKSVQKMSRELSAKMDSSYKNSLRLVNTEVAAVMTSASQKSYESMEVERYIFIGTLDQKTSKICQSLDGKVFKMSEMQIGKNASPMHPHCRSSIAPYFSDDDLGQRRAKDSDGNSIIVENMNYEEWASKYLK